MGACCNTEQARDDEKQQEIKMQDIMSPRIEQESMMMFGNTTEDKSPALNSHRGKVILRNDIKTTDDIT